MLKLWFIWLWTCSYLCWIVLTLNAGWWRFFINQHRNTFSNLWKLTLIFGDYYCWSMGWCTTVYFESEKHMGVCKYSASSIIWTGWTQFKDVWFVYADNRGWSFDPFPCPLKDSFLAWLKRKLCQKRKLLFVSDTHDSHNKICQENSKFNEEKTLSVYILWKKDLIVLCLRPSLVFG